MQPARVILRGMKEPFVGSEALRRGSLSRHQLRTRYRAVFPDVYLANDAPAALRTRTIAAWLWSGRRGIIVGGAAAGMHGSKWIPENFPVELSAVNTVPPQGIVRRRGRLAVGETQVIDGLTITTPERTAFDIGRGGAIRSAVVRLDALARATGFKIEDVLRVAKSHPGSPGLRQLETALELVDSGAQSPRESYLRLLLIDAGLPRPQTQIPVLGAESIPLAYLDMGWEDLMVAVEYDGDQHRTDRRQYVKDIRRLEMLEQMGWIVVRVVAEDGPASIIRRVKAAIAASSGC